MPTEAPWLERKEWADNRIASGSKVGLIVTWCFAAFWNAISWPVMFDSSIYAEISRSPETALVFLFPLIGIVILGVAIYSTLSWRKFGKTPLVLDPFPASLGGHLGGSIQLNIPFSQNYAFHVRAACMKSYISGSGKNRSRKETAVWQSEGVCFSAPTEKGSVLSFRFDLPASLPESEPKTGNTYYLWRVSVECELPGTDYHRDFEVPVYKGLRKSSQIQENTAEFHKTIDQAYEGIQNIAEISNISGGISAYFPALKRPASGIFATLFGSIFFGTGIFLGTTDAPAIMPYSFGLSGFLIAAYGIWDLSKSLRITVTRNAISSRRFLFGYPITTRQTKPEHVKRFEIKQGASLNNGKKQTIYYSLQLHTDDKQKLVAGERLTSRPEAELLKETIETFAGIRE